MKKFTRILSLVLALLMLSCMLIACEKDDDKGGTTTGKSGVTTTKKNDNKASYNVKFVDGVTGETLLEKSIKSGGSALCTLPIDNLHYGYKSVGYKYNDDDTVYPSNNQKIYEDTVVTLVYEKKAVYEIELLDKNGNPINLEGFVIKERYETAAEIIASDTLENRIKTNYNGGFTKKFLSEGDKIKVYEGDTITLSSILEYAPAVVANKFDHWTITSTTDKGKDFTGENISASYTIQAVYTPDGIMVFKNEADVNLTEDAIKKINQTGGLVNVSTRNGSEFINSTNPAAGNEKLLEGDTVITNEVGTFRCVNTFGNLVYKRGRDTSDRLNPATSVINKFTSKDSTFYNNSVMQIDQNTYIAYDGEVAYAYVVVRDDTPYEFYGTIGKDGKSYNSGATKNSDDVVEYDYVTWIENKMNPGEGGIPEIPIIYNAGDNVEIRFFIGDDKDIPTTDYTGVPRYQYSLEAQQKYENALRTITVDRSGLVRINRETVGDSGEGHVNMHNYVEVLDLNGEEKGKNLHLYGEDGKENGYVVGLKFRIKDYMLASGKSYSEGELEDGLTRFEFSKLVIGIQVNDRYDGVSKEVAGEGKLYVDYTQLADEDKNDLNNRDTGHIAGGTQDMVSQFTTVTLIRSAETDAKKPESAE